MIPGPGNHWRAPGPHQRKCAGVRGTSLIAQAPPKAKHPQPAKAASQSWLRGGGPGMAPTLEAPNKRSSPHAGLVAGIGRSAPMRAMRDRCGAERAMLGMGRSAPCAIKLIQDHEPPEVTPQGPRHCVWKPAVHSLYNGCQRTKIRSRYWLRVVRDGV